MQKEQLNTTIILHGLQWQVPSSNTDPSQSKLQFTAVVIFDLLAFCATQIGSVLPTFREQISIPSSWTALILKAVTKRR